MPMIYSNLNHALRVPLAAEVHSRPFLQLQAPESITHLAVYARDGIDPGISDMTTQHAYLAGLCEHFGVAAPGSEATFFFHDFGHFRLKWEGHTEFATYTFAQRREDTLTIEEAFAQAPLHQIPQ